MTIYICGKPDWMASSEMIRGRNEAIRHLEHNLYNVDTVRITLTQKQKDFWDGYDSGKKEYEHEQRMKALKEFMGR